MQCVVIQQKHYTPVAQFINVNRNKMNDMLSGRK